MLGEDESQLRRKVEGVSVLHSSSYKLDVGSSRKELPDLPQDFPGLMAACLPVVLGSLVRTRKVRRGGDTSSVLIHFPALRNHFMFQNPNYF